MAKKPKSSYKVDFTDVESNALFAEGAGRFKVVKVEYKDSGDDGAFQWTWEVTEHENPKFVGKTFSDRTSLAEGALWNLRNRLEALGVEVPAGPLDVEFSDLEGLELEAENSHREYDGKKYNQLGNYVAIDESATDVKVTDKRKKKDEDEEDDEPKSKKSRKDEDDEDEPKSKKKKKSDEDDEDEPKSKKKKSDDEDDDEPKKKRSRDEDDEEDEPKAKKKKSSDDEDDEEPKKKSKKKYTEDEVRDMDEDELGDLVEKHDLPVKLSKIDNLRKKRIAVVDALQDEELIED